MKRLWLANSIVPIAAREAEALIMMEFLGFSGERMFRLAWVAYVALSLFKAKLV